MKSDYQIQEDVMEELKWEPFLKASEIGVAVRNGVVTLSGHVDSYSKKVAAENAAKKVVGVKAVAEDIEVGISPSYRKTDTEIAEAALDALQWHNAVQEEKIKIKVEDGNIKLEGEVDWEYQRTMAKRAIENLAGVRLVTNLITVKPNISPYDIQKKINAAFHRSATVDSRKIETQVDGSRVTLRGIVRSIAEKEDAENAAWFAPGVTSVVNQIEIEVPEYEYEEE
jgi:osmotically-inducible protein OsmY